jgi:hypothetical protein
MRAKLFAGLAGAALMFAASPTWAAVISINDLIGTNNPSFENGTTNWIFSGSSGIYVPGAAQYSSGGAPDGTHVAQIPAPPNGSTGAIEYDLQVKFVNGMDYSLTYWVGTPLGFTTPGRIDVGLVQSITGVGQYLTDNIANDPKSVTGVLVGQWTQITTTWTSGDINNGGNANIGSEHYLGVYFQAFANGGVANNYEVDFDLATPTQGNPGDTPLPAAVWMFGSVLAGSVGAGAWRRRKKNAV